MRSYGQFCSLARALDVVGDRWNLLIVRELMLRGPSRYTDLMAGLPGIATNLLADRLRDLEHAAVVSRREALPPVATAVFELTERGRALEPVIRELGRWGFELMPGTDPDYAFRSHWLALPVSLYLHDRESGGPPATIEVRLGDDPVILEAVEDEVRTRPRTETDDPDLVVSGPPLAFLGLISRKLDLAAARARGLHTEGELAALERLLPEPAASAPAP